MQMASAPSATSGWTAKLAGAADLTGKVAGHEPAGSAAPGAALVARKPRPALKPVSPLFLPLLCHDATLFFSLILSFPSL